MVTEVSCLGNDYSNMSVAEGIADQPKIDIVATGRAAAWKNEIDYDLIRWYNLNEIFFWLPFLD